MPLSGSSGRIGDPEANLRRFANTQRGARVIRESIAGARRGQQRSPRGRQTLRSQRIAAERATLRGRARGIRNPAGTTRVTMGPKKAAKPFSLRGGGAGRTIRGGQAAGDSGLFGIGTIDLDPPGGRLQGPQAPVSTPGPRPVPTPAPLTATATPPAPRRAARRISEINRTPATRRVARAPRALAPSTSEARSTTRPPAGAVSISEARSTIRPPASRSTNSRRRLQEERRRRRR